MKTHFPLIAATTAVLFTTVPSALAEEIQPDGKIVYKTVGDVQLQLHLFKPADWKPTDRRPAIVFFFGGGWVGGSPSQFYPHCRYLASRGMVAAAAEYRMKNQHGTTPIECVMDGKSAIRYVRGHAAELGVDPDRIAAGGGSAGGHVAAACGTLEKFNQPGEDTAVDARPGALVLFNPVFDNGPDGWGHDRVKNYWRDISPLHNISKQTPPTIVFLGTADRLIPVATAEKYRRAMADAGIRCDVHLYDDQPHGFFNYRDGGNTYYYQTVIAADRFLQSLGYLEGEPTLRDPTGK